MKPNGLDELMGRVQIRADGCWLFTGPTNAKGYGYMSFRSKLWRAHRVSWVLHVGEIPAGLNVCHSCDEPACVNPGHLLLGTQMANIRDAVKKGNMVGNSAPRSAAAVERIREGARASWAQLSLDERQARSAPSARARAGKPRGRYKPCPDRTCGHCGGQFAVTYPSSQKRYCSRRCARQSRR